MKYKVVMSAIDGTLVDSNRRISPKIKEMIQAFQNQGGIFTLATGRMEGAARKFYDELNIQSPAILYNGSKIVDLYKNQCLFEHRLNENHTKEAMKLLETCPYDVLVYYEGKAYVKEMNDVIEEYMEKDGIECTVVDEWDKYITKPPTKIMIIGDPKYFEQFEQQFNEVCATAPNMVNSEPTYLEILPSGVSKGYTVDKLSELLQVPKSEMVAIGDNLNDIEMIQKVGLGVADANAHPKVLETADYITKSNEEDGVADVLEKILNNKI
jgi:Cof subfamily protein (haloacid dehalogenase superfamily)